jgi:GxxExxY protein
MRVRRTLNFSGLSSCSLKKRQENNPRMTQMSTDQNDPRTHQIIGAAMEVHNHLGHGFLEPVYQEAMALELRGRGISFQREVPILVKYKGAPLCCSYRADFICFDEIIVELKALSMIGGTEQAQVLNYLKATGFQLGLLLNFGAPRLEIKRLRFDLDLCPSVKSVD